MREAADQIHAEVGHLLDDVRRLRERVLKLQAAFRAGRRGRAPDPDLVRQDREARRTHRLKSTSRRMTRAAVRRIISGADHPEARSRRIVSYDSDPRVPRARLVRGSHRGLSPAARADRDVPRLLGRAAAGAVRLDLAGVDARGRRRPRHHRPVRAGRHALHRQVPVGAGRRRPRHSGPVAAARPPARLADLLAAAADGDDRVPRAMPIPAARPGWWRSAPCW